MRCEGQTDEMWRCVKLRRRVSRRSCCTDSSTRSAEGIIQAESSTDNSSSSSWCGVKERCRRSPWRSGNWSTLNVTWCQHDRRSDSRLASQHCRCRAVMRAIISPYLDRLTQFILHSSPAPSVPANRPCRPAPTSSRCKPATRDLFSNNVSSSCCKRLQSLWIESRISRDKT